jgi:hypothetical protein
MSEMKDTLRFITRTLANAKSIFTRKDAKEYVKKYAPQHSRNLDLAFKSGYIKRLKFWGFDLSKKGEKTLKYLEDISNR